MILMTLTQISRAHHYLTLSVSETAQSRNIGLVYWILIGTYVLNGVILNGLEWSWATQQNFQRHRASLRQLSFLFNCILLLVLIYLNLKHLKQSFSTLFTHSQPFNEMFIFSGKSRCCNGMLLTSFLHRCICKSAASTKLS